MCRSSATFRVDCSCRSSLPSREATILNTLPCSTPPPPPPQSLPLSTHPPSVERISTLLSPAISVAVVTYILTINVAKAVAAKNRLNVDANQEVDKC